MNRISNFLKMLLKILSTKNLKLKTKNWPLNCLLSTAYWLLLLLFVLLMIALPFPLSKGGVGVVEASTRESVKVKPQIAAGDGHTVALKSDGTLWAWGINNFGQLGDGTIVEKHSPIQIGTDNKWVAVAAGNAHTVALKSDGTLWAWGNNCYSQLGDGTIVDKTTPTQIGTDNKWITITAEAYHTIALKSDGTLWAWGANFDGQLGDGTSAGKTTPTQIGTDNNWIAVSAGYYHTLALKSDGSLWAWGFNGYGQLGDGTTASKSSPVQIGTDNKWVAIAGGLKHSLALKSDGTLWAWGYNFYGQLGDGTTTNKSSPVQIGTDNKWVSVSAGFYHTLALKSDGTLWAWGVNASGQLGDGTIVDKSSPVQIGTDNKWVSVAAGDYHTVALKSDGTLWAWGVNNLGQLGDGTTDGKSSPVQIMQAGTGNEWGKISAGGYYTVTLKSDGTLWAWGFNNYGQLGDGTTTQRNSAVQIGTDNNWVSISTGWAHTIALRSDGTVWAWGNNENGQLGDGTTVNKSSPVQIGTDNKWVYVSAGSYHTLALKSDGTLWAWGNNSSSQLGDGTTTQKNSPVQIGITNVVAISAGGYHSTVIKSDGTLWAWGGNWYGELGDGTTVDKSIPTQIGTDNKWIQIKAGNRYNAALKSDGTSWEWGDTHDGQGGNGTTTPVQIGSDNKWVSIATKYYHSIALKSDGTLWAWGSNGAGQLGDGTTTDKYSPVKIGTDTSWVAISTGDFHSVALKSDGTLWAWGYNGSGQLGDCTTTDRLSPVQITGTCAVQLPRTGQTTSYATGDDGAIQAGVAWPSPRFTDNADQTITDNLTGLIWTKDAGTPTVGSCTGGTMNWQAALDYVACLNTNNYLGHNDWRLPNINELESLIFTNAGQPNMATWLNTQGFTNVNFPYIYWSSSTDSNAADRAWVANIRQDGYNTSNSVKDSGSAYYAWPVRSGIIGTIQIPKTGQTTSYATGDDGNLQKGTTWPSARFTDNGNGTVTDNLTGLIWLKNANCFGSRSWSQGLSDAKNLVSGQCGLSDGSQAGDWRLPNRKELFSLIDFSKYNPALPSGHPFTDVQSDWYWSSTTWAYDTLRAWAVYVGYSYVDSTGQKDYSFYYVWPVRGGTVTGGGDTTPPTGTISINSGATYTNSTSVTLTLSCSDANGCAEMKFSNDNVTYYPLTAETYATSKAWTLTGGDGTKTVYAKFKDTAGNWSGAYSDTIVLDTTVSAPSNIEANQNGNKGELVITWTKPSDSDFSHIHIYRSTTSGVLGSLIADNQTGIKYTDTNLASQTTYYYTVRAVDNLGNESTNTTQYSGTTLDATPPGVPSNITATDAGTGGKINLSWTNPADSDFSHIHIYRSTTSGALGSLVYDNITGTSKSDTGLTNGVTYYYTVRAVDTSDNETTNTAQVSATPTAPDISAPGAVSGVVISDPATGGVLNLSWTNPADGDFSKVRIYRSTIEGQLGSLVHEVTGTSVSDTGLTSNTTYYYTFRTVDTVGNESTDTTQYSGMPTDTVAPNPITELTTTLLSGGKVKLDWIRSSSDDINYYNIYYDNGTGTIDYSTAIASIQHPTVTWTSAALTVGTRYQFAIRAEDTSLNKETNTNVISVVPVTDPNAGDVSASIKVPQTGKKVCGNMVTVVAELIMGTVADTQKIRLQYKTVASGTWSDIPSTDPAKFPNPDTTSPYFVHWDVTTLADGDYNLRAVATSNALVTDSNPLYITITVDSVNCSSQETTNAGGEKTKAEDVSKNASSNQMMAGLITPGVTTVSLPEGSLNADTTINITESDPATKAGLVPSGYSNGSSFNEIGFESGQTTLANNKKATVEMPYKDNDNNGIVDGTSVKAYDLQVCDYNSGTGKWTCLDSLVDTDKKTVKAKTEKFSLFGLLMPPKPVGAEWNLLSVPLQPSPNTPSAVFGSVTNYTNYVLWWNPAIGDYQIVSTIDTGKSYWVWGNGKNLGTVSGTETPNSNFSISIKKGWNMIGHPFRYKVNVSDFWIYYGGNYYTIADAETNGWVVATIYSYKDGAYQFSNASDGGVIEAWKGYWILSDIDCTLIIPPTPAQ